MVRIDTSRHHRMAVGRLETGEAMHMRTFREVGPLWQNAGRDCRASIEACRLEYPAEVYGKASGLRLWCMQMNPVCPRESPGNENGGINNWGKSKP